MGQTGDRPPRRFEPPFVHLGDGLVARMFADGPVVQKATAAFLKANPPPDLTNVTGILRQQRALSALRTEMATRTPAVAPGTVFKAGSVFRPGGGLIPPVIDIVLRNRPSLSRPPTIGETAIEAPYRLVISPGPEARFAHATDPVPADDDAQHVELWHSRLANIPADPTKPPDEKNARRRIVRAIWARDRDYVGDAWRSKADESNPAVFPLSHADPRVPGNNVDPPFLGSLDRFDRHMLVRQTAETWIGADGKIAPVPVAADELWLSSLGAWLGLHGAWTTKPYSKPDANQQTMQSILAWDHVAPMGRDQYVRVVYPGYLYPFGHQTALVKVTERKMKDATGSVAGLYQRMFLVIGERTRTYPDVNGRRHFPFERVDIRPLVTPPIKKPGTSQSDSQETMFWPVVGNGRFPFVIDAVDREHRPVRLHMPLIWVNEAFSTQANMTFVDGQYAGDPDRIVPADGQSIGYVPNDGGPDTHLDTEKLFFLGTAQFGESVPRMSAATVVVPAVQQLSATGPLPVRFREEYVAAGFGTPTTGEVWAEVLHNVVPGSLAPNDPTAADLPQLRFGAPPPAPPPGTPTPSGSDKAGGFLAPDLPIRALSRATGPIGDIASSVNNKIDPAAFLSGALPKLFGLIPLDELISAVAGDLQIPQVITETLGRIEQFITDAQRLIDLVEDAEKQAQALVQRAQDKSNALQAQAQDAVDKADKLSTDAQAFAPKFLALAAALPSLDRPTIQPKVKPCFDALDRVVADARAVVGLLPPQVATELTSLVDGLAEMAQAQNILDMLLDVTDLKQRFRFEWRPDLENWPAGSAPIFSVRGTKKDHLVLAVEGTIAGPAPDVMVTAEIRDFDLVLFGSTPLMKVPFDHMFFKAGSSGKPEIDVVLGNIEFLGLLSFVETIKDLIPLDGFSDPPFMDVSPQGATAGFTLELPNISIGVFSLANMSLGADVSIPFLGKSVTVGFSFCSRERPFSLTVMCLGGGGWFLVRVAPDGLDVLELGLEATACLAIDLGVASGSISASIGVYIRLEGKKGSLTGYFRLRGEVDVLGLISASIELYMELVYQFDTGKMLGRATITVEVDVLFFSGSVRISAERQFAGSNGDPSFREILGAEDGTSPAWAHYCHAFAAE